MYEIDTETGWSEIPGTSGLAVKLLSGDFDEANARGFNGFEPSTPEEAAEHAKEVRVHASSN